MNTSEKEFSPQESLAVIRSMIESTKHSIGDQSHFYLLWGWATMIGCVVQYFLLEVVHYKHHYFAWIVTPIALVLHFIFLYKYDRKEQVKTFISEATGYVWLIVGLSFFALSFVFTKIGWQYSFPFYILMYGIGTYISGSLVKFNAMRIGGASCLVLAAITPYLYYKHQILIAAFAILISYIIPGHILRSQYRRSKNISNA